MSPRGRLATGVGGGLLLVSLFLPWAGGELDASGWELLPVIDIFLLITALVGLGAAVTGGRFGLFRPDVSLIGAADILSVVATILVGWLLIVDFPDGVGAEIGIYLGLLAAIVQAAGAADYEAVRRGEMFAPTGRPPETGP